MNDAEDITVKDYIPRIVDSMVDEYLHTFPAVSIEGRKWCGKTTTAMHHASFSFSPADPARNFRNRELAGIEPNLALEGFEQASVEPMIYKRCNRYPRAIGTITQLPGECAAHSQNGSVTSQ